MAFEERARGFVPFGANPAGVAAAMRVFDGQSWKAIEGPAASCRRFERQPVVHPIEIVGDSIRAPAVPTREQGMCRALHDGGLWIAFVSTVSRTTAEKSASDDAPQRVSRTVQFSTRRGPGSKVWRQGPTHPA